MKYISELTKDHNIKAPLSLNGCGVKLGAENRVNIVALGDVGATVLMGLRLLGSDCISSIGIFDLSENNVGRLEMEINQINYPFGEKRLPHVEPITEENMFDCDLFVFCASRGVPPIGSGGDVRMAQLDANRAIIAHYAGLAKKADYKGMVAVVSDPVDPLCRAFLDASGLKPWQISGYGLGVMNARALYYASKEERFAAYSEEGRAFGPHGGDLVIADSIENYDDNLSKELTKLVVEANLRVRDLGYKPYIAPAFSSAAISLILTLEGKWHYSSLYFGDAEDGAFMGVKNRFTDCGPEYEDLPLDDKLYERISKAYEGLLKLK